MTNNNPLILNQCSYLENIFVNANTIFDNLCAYSKVNSINIANGKNFEQTENDLDISELTLESATKIQFTHNRSNYKFINPSPSNDLVIRNLYNIAEDSKSINTIKKYNDNKTGDYDSCHLAMFKFFNPEVLQLGDIPDSQ
ncbi:MULTISPECIES: hypothetical protein [unclassified Rickettsia]|uniref:hypothetical protein n=1 Tax=unclassified Rickettsia TaxID=114295 RepID=UPI0031332855